MLSDVSDDDDDDDDIVVVNDKEHRGSTPLGGRPAPFPTSPDNDNVSLVWGARAAETNPKTS